MSSGIPCKHCGHPGWRHWERRAWGTCMSCSGCPGYEPRTSTTPKSFTVPATTFTLVGQFDDAEFRKAEAMLSRLGDPGREAIRRFTEVAEAQAKGRLCNVAYHESPAAEVVYCTRPLGHTGVHSWAVPEADKAWNPDYDLQTITPGPVEVRVGGNTLQVRATEDAIIDALLALHRGTTP